MHSYSTLIHVILEPFGGWAIRKGSDAMRGEQINHVSRRLVIVLSLIALFTVLSGYTQPRQPDEGAAAHIFQLSIVALSTDALSFPDHRGLEAAFAKCATFGISSRCFGSHVWSPVLP